MLVSPQAFGSISGNINVMAFKNNFCSCAEHPFPPVVWGEKGEFLPLPSHLLAPKTRQILVPPLGHNSCAQKSHQLHVLAYGSFPKDFNQHRNDMDLLDHVQRRVMKMIRGMEPLSTRLRVGVL